MRVRFSNPLGCCAVAARRTIKVLSDLRLLFQLISIDIQVLSDLVVRFGWYAIAARRGAIILFLLRLLAILLQKQDFQDVQDFQDGAAQECGGKVWKTLMSIERRSLISIASLILDILIQTKNITFFKKKFDKRAKMWYTIYRPQAQGSFKHNEKEKRT